MTNDTMAKYSQILENLAGQLDIAPSKYQLAVERYTSVGKWLEGCDYEGCQAEPKIYPQGSFRLGTVVRPIMNGEESDYDIDLVCELQKAKASTTAKKVKADVGARLMENEAYRKMLEQEGRRCWTLNYAEKDGIGFHIDVLPSIPEDAATKIKLQGAGVPLGLAEKAISITHKENGIYTWSGSNPNGYVEWFDLLKEPMFNQVSIKQKQQIYESNYGIFEKVDSVPDQLVRTPLQRAIQILKRHRDMRFAGTPVEADKPISMIITTLAAQLYENEVDVYLALKNIVEKLEAHANLINPGFRLDEKLASRRIIMRVRDGWYIPNPVNPYENFADRWHEENHRRAKAFFTWVSWVGEDLVKILAKANMNIITESLAKVFGANAITKASSGVVSLAPTILVSGRHEPPHVEIRNPSKPWSDA